MLCKDSSSRGEESLSQQRRAMELGARSEGGTSLTGGSFVNFRPGGAEGGVGYPEPPRENSSHSQPPKTGKAEVERVSSQK